MFVFFPLPFARRQVADSDLDEALRRSVEVATRRQPQPSSDEEDVFDHDEEAEVAEARQAPTAFRRRTKIIASSSDEEEPVVLSGEEGPEASSEDEEEMMPPASKRTRYLTHEEQRAHQASKHLLREPCECQWACREHVSEERRRAIHREFWAQHYEERRGMARQLVDKIVGHSLRYFLRNDQGEKVHVCRTMFLATLGYKRTSKYIYCIFKVTGPGQSVPPKSRRGKASPVASLVDKESIRSHIESYNPAIPHYRYLHLVFQFYTCKTFMQHVHLFL